MKVTTSLIIGAAQGSVLGGSGLYLLVLGLEQSWFHFRPPGSEVWYTSFHPYWIALVPAFAFLGAALVVGIAHVVTARRFPGASIDPLAADLATANLFLGGAVLIVQPFVSIGTICANPGGCHTVLFPFWPLLVPAFLLLGFGAFGRWFITFGARLQRPVTPE